MTYRVLLRAAGPRFLVLGFLGRLPYSIGALATLTLVASATGDLAVAGFAGGVQAVGTAVGGPLAGALADRFGTRRIGLAFALAGAAALAGLILATRLGPAAMVLAAAAVGLAQVPVGALTRVWWSERVDPRLVGIAMSYEGAVDELSFVAGPALAGVLAAGSPLAPTAVSAAVMLGIVAPFVVGLPRRAPARVRSGEPLPWRPLGVLTAGMAAMGTVFGSLQVGVTAAGGGGLLYALLGAGSAVAGLACGRLADRVGLPVRAAALLGGTGLVASGVLPLPVAVTVCGAGVAPYMIMLFVLTQRVAPPRRITTAVTVLCAGGPLGTAAGATLAGVLAQHHGAAAAFAVAPVAAGCALLLAVAGRRITAPAPRA